MLNKKLKIIKKIDFKLKINIKSKFYLNKKILFVLIYFIIIIYSLKICFFSLNLFLPILVQRDSASCIEWVVKVIAEFLNLRL
jgi:hypothetical protein